MTITTTEDVAYVVVTRSFDSGMTIEALEPYAAGHWPIRLDAVKNVTRLIAVFKGRPIAAWRVRGVFETEWVYGRGRHFEGRRIGFAVGGALPMIEEYMNAPVMSGDSIRVVALQLPPLIEERPQG